MSKRPRVAVRGPDQRLRSLAAPAVGASRPRSPFVPLKDSFGTCNFSAALTYTPTHDLVHRRTSLITRSRPLRSRTRVPPRTVVYTSTLTNPAPLHQPAPPPAVSCRAGQNTGFMWVQQLRPFHAALLVEVSRARERDACSTRQASRRVHLGLLAAQPPPYRSRPLACVH